MTKRRRPPSWPKPPKPPAAPLIIDIAAIEAAQKLPHWLSPLGRNRHLLKEIRERRRAEWLKTRNKAGTADTAKAASRMKTLSERLEEVGIPEATSPPGGTGFVVTGASGFKRSRKGR